jgi:hypothetical protein
VEEALASGIRLNNNQKKLVNEHEVGNFFDLNRFYKVEISFIERVDKY